MYKNIDNMYYNSPLINVRSSVKNYCTSVLQQNMQKKHVFPCMPKSHKFDIIDYSDKFVSSSLAFMKCEVFV